MIAISTIALLAVALFGPAAAQNTHRTALGEFAATAHWDHGSHDVYLDGKLVHQSPGGLGPDIDATFVVALEYNTEYELALKIGTQLAVDSASLSSSLRIDGLPQFDGTTPWMASLTEVAGWNEAGFDAAASGFTAGKHCDHNYGVLSRNEAWDNKNVINRITHDSFDCVLPDGTDPIDMWFYLKFTTPSAPVNFAVTDCNSHGSKYSILEGAEERCLCDSRYEGGDCATTFVNSACEGTVESLTVDNSEAEIIYADIVGQDLVMTAKMPNVVGRTFESITVRDCDADKFVDLQTTQTWLSCEDHVTVSVPVASLKNLCGFGLQESVTYQDKLHALYTGEIRIKYTETVALANTVARRAVQDQTREVDVILPIQVYLRTEYTLPTIDDLKIYTDYDIKAAVTGQSIDPSGGKSTVTVTYAVHFPYTVTSYAPEVRVDASAFLNQGDVNIVTTASPGVHLLEYDDYQNGVWTSKERTALTVSDSINHLKAGIADAAACQAAAVADGDDTYTYEQDTQNCYTWSHAVDVVAAGGSVVEQADVENRVSGWNSQVGTYVLRELELEFVHTGCELDGTFTIEQIVVDCASGLPAVDCPLYEPQGGNEISFSLDSENFCADGGFSTVISDALEITEFLAVPKDDLNAAEQQNAWLWGEKAYFRAGFEGLQIERVDMMSLTTSAESHATEFATGPGAVMDDTSLIPGVGQMGLDFGTQKYFFEHPMSLAFAGPEPSEGVGTPLTVRCTVNVGYYAAPGARRRRAVQLRQEASEEAGVGTVEATGAVRAPVAEAQTTEAPAVEGASAIDRSGAPGLRAGLLAALAGVLFVAFF